MRRGRERIGCLVVVDCSGGDDDVDGNADEECDNDVVVTVRIRPGLVLVVVVVVVAGPADVEVCPA